MTRSPRQEQRDRDNQLRAGIAAGQERWTKDVIETRE